MKLQAKLVLAVGTASLVSFGLVATLDHCAGEVAPYLLQMLFSFLVICCLLRLYVTDRLKPLQTAADAISKGDFNVGLDMDGRDEIAEVARAFRSMSEAIGEREQRLRRGKARLLKAQRIAQVGSWEWDIAKDRVVWSEEAGRIYGMLPWMHSAGFWTFLAYVHPEDLPSLEAAFENARQAGTSIDLEHRIGHPDRGVRHVHLQGETVFDEERRATHVSATVHDITDHKVKEAIIRHREDFQRTVARISTRFVELSTLDADRGIEFALAELGQYCAVDRAYVFLYSSDGITMSNTHEWCAPGISAQIENLQGVPFAMVPWWMGEMEKRQAIDISVVDDLPEEAAQEKRIFQAQEIQSLVAVPMIGNGRIIGFLGFDSVQQKKSWPTEDLAMLQTAGEIIVNALERKKARVDLQESEARFRDIAVCGADWIWEVDARGAYTFCSERVEEILGFAVSEVLGRTAYDFMPAEETLRSKDICSRMQAEKKPIQDLETWVCRRDGQKIRIVTSGVPILDKQGNVQGYRGVSKDITARTAAEEALRKLNRALRTLSAGNAAILQATSEEALLAEMCRVATDTGGYRMAWIGFAGEGGGKRVRPVASAGDGAGYLDSLQVTWDEGALGKGPIGRMIRTGQPTLSSNIPEDPCFDPWRDRVQEWGFGSCLALPLLEGERTFGALAIYAAESDAFDENEIRLLSDLAKKLSYGLRALRAGESRKIAEQAANAERVFLQKVVDGIADPLLVIAPNRHVLLENQAAKGSPLEAELVAGGRDCHRIRHGSDHPCPSENQPCTLELTLQTGKPATVVQKRQSPDGGERIFEIKASPFWRDDGSLLGIIEVSRDITEHLNMREKLKENTEHLNYLAYHDPLTNLPNRLLFQDRLSQAMAKAHRIGEKVALLLLDLDRFKNINDSLGHGAGDKVLCEVGRRLREAVRQADTVARLGGDEFVVILDAIKDEDHIAAIVRRLQEALRPAFKVEDLELHFTASIGISTFPVDAEDFEGMMKCADVAMYKAKDQGRNSYQFYRATMNFRSQELFLLENGLRSALEENQFVLHYQPQIDLISGRLVGVEALLRWRHPERGMVSPADFIPLAEETGLIVPIGAWVLHEACAQNRAWQTADYPPIKMAINISGRHFREADFVDQVERALAATGLEPQWLELEITESTVMKNVEEVIKTLTDLRIRGISLSVDDFGTGYSSLSYLKRFPLSNLKIDRSFIREVPHNQHDVAIATAIVALAQSMNLEVVAEGIETEEQAWFLKAKGCQMGQGFLFSRPLPSLELVPILKSGSCLKSSSSFRKTDFII